MQTGRWINVGLCVVFVAVFLVVAIRDIKRPGRSAVVGMVFPLVAGAVVMILKFALGGATGRILPTLNGVILGLVVTSKGDLRTLTNDAGLVDIRGRRVLTFGAVVLSTLAVGLVIEEIP